MSSLQNLVERTTNDVYVLEQELELKLRTDQTDSSKIVEKRIETYSKTLQNIVKSSKELSLLKSEIKSLVAYKEKVMSSGKSAAVKNKLFEHKVMKISEVLSYFPNILNEIVTELEAFKTGSNSVNLFQIYKKAIRLKLWKYETEESYSRAEMGSVEELNLWKEKIEEPYSKADLGRVEKLENELFDTCFTIIGALFRIDTQSLISALRCIESFEAQSSQRRHQLLSQSYTLDFALSLFPLGMKRRVAIQKVNDRMKIQIETTFKELDSAAEDDLLGVVLSKGAELVAELKFVVVDLDKLFPDFYGVGNSFLREFEKKLLNTVQRLGDIGNWIDTSSCYEMLCFLSVYFSLCASAATTKKTKIPQSKRLNKRKSILNQVIEQKKLETDIDKLKAIEESDLTALYLDAKRQLLYKDTLFNFCIKLTDNIIIAAEDRLNQLLVNLLKSQHENKRIGIDIVNIVIQEMSVLEIKSIHEEFCDQVIEKVAFIFLNSYLEKALFSLEERFIAFSCVAEETKKSKSAYFSKIKKKKKAKVKSENQSVDIKVFEKLVIDCCNFVNVVETLYDFIDTKIRRQIKGLTTSNDIQTQLRYLLDRASQSSRRGIRIVEIVFSELFSQYMANALSAIEEREELFKIVLVTIEDYFSSDGLQSWFTSSADTGKVILNTLNDILSTYYEALLFQSLDADLLSQQINRDCRKLKQCFGQFRENLRFAGVRTAEEFDSAFEGFNNAASLLVSSRPFVPKCLPTDVIHHLLSLNVNISDKGRKEILSA